MVVKNVPQGGVMEQPVIYVESYIQNDAIQ
ncbi:MAG: Uncharacterised protein [Prochlorococcus marinus str. MIT 9313]|nr:MAG: Uncharacterised protein [Prochlorococcus marinus str. MIT 9313]